MSEVLIGLSSFYIYFFSKQLISGVVDLTVLAFMTLNAAVLADEGRISAGGGDVSYFDTI